MRNEGKGKPLTNETITQRGKKDKGTLTLRTQYEMSRLITRLT